MVVHGGLASALPLLVHSEEEEQVNVLVGVQHAPPYGVGKTAQEVGVGQQAVAADPGARWFNITINRNAGKDPYMLHSPDTLAVFGHKSANFRTYFKNKSVLEVLQSVKSIGTTCGAVI